jgi:hypothetical protein
MEIQVFDAGGQMVAAQAIKPYEVGKRISVWAANAQRKLDALIAAHPEAVRATIGPTEFEVRNGRSSAIWGRRDA